MATDNESKPVSPGGRSGCALLAIVICGLILALVWRNLARVDDGSGRLLIEKGAWAAGMALLCGLAVARIRRDTTNSSGPAYIALIICLASITWVAVDFVMIMLR